MSILTGEYRHTADAKGRLFMPSRLLKALGEPFYVMVGADPCLTVYPRAQWEALQEKLDGLPMSQTRKLRRALFSSAQECTPDGQGRILLAQNLREYAGIDKDIVIVGVGAYAEIWSAAEWKKENESAEPVGTSMEAFGL